MRGCCGAGCACRIQSPSGSITVSGNGSEGFPFLLEVAATSIGSGTTDALDDAGSTVNTENKEPGRQVWNTTDERPVWATGAGPTATWVYSDGTTAHSPS